MNHRRVKYPSTFPPTYDHGRDYGTCVEGRPRAYPLLTPRSSAGPGPYHRTNSVHLTKARPFRTHFSAEHGCSRPTHFPGPHIDRGRRVGRPEPDSTTEDSSVL